MGARQNTSGQGLLSGSQAVVLQTNCSNDDLMSQPLHFTPPALADSSERFAAALRSLNTGSGTFITSVDVA